MVSAQTSSLSDFVDNSESEYFPDIESQGSLGAFKVANSWGTERHNKGFYWFSYDSLNRYTSVSGGSSTNRYSAVWDVAKIEVRPYGEGSDLYIRYTLNTCDRGQGKMYITATKGDEVYTYEAGPKRKFGMNSSTLLISTDRCHLLDRKSEYISKKRTHYWVRFVLYFAKPISQSPLMISGWSAFLLLMNSSIKSV